MSDEARLEAALNAYVEKFGYLPVGLGMPDLGAEILETAVETEKEIEPPPLPDGAVY